MYIDLVKAYDSVEHWRLEQILTNYRFNEEVTKLIKKICENN